jgi:hypothetical protein
MASTLNSTVEIEALRLYEALARSRVDLTSVTFDQSCSLERVCGAKVRKQSRKVRQLLAVGHTNRARREQLKLLRGLAARLYAAYQALRVEARQLRRRGKPPREFSFEYIWSLTERQRNDFAASIACRRSRRKADGSRRTYFTFNTFGIARQKQLTNAIKPFASFHPSQVMLRGGRSAACESLLNSANDPRFRKGYFVKADVRSYYDAISHEFLEEVIPAPKAIIRSTLLLHGWNIIGVAMDQRGIPQGSAASSLVGEMVMAKVLGSIADQLPATLVTYSDDLAGLVPAETDAVSLAECLTHAFRTHGAGPFSLRVEIKPTQGAFRFLGYEFERTLEKFEMNAPPGLADARHIEFLNAFADAWTVHDWLAVCQRLQSFYAAYRSAVDVRHITADILGFVREELRRRGAIAA